MIIFYSRQQHLLGQHLQLSLRLLRGLRRPLPPRLPGHHRRAHPPRRDQPVLAQVRPARQLFVERAEQRAQLGRRARARSRGRGPAREVQGGEHAVHGQAGRHRRVGGHLGGHSG